VCDDAGLTVSDAFKDVLQCSDRGKGFGGEACLPSQKSAGSTGLPQFLGLELVLTVCTAAYLNIHIHPVSEEAVGVLSFLRPVDAVNVNLVVNIDGLSCSC
jgi:hypothetical protein